MVEQKISERVKKYFWIAITSKMDASLSPSFGPGLLCKIYYPYRNN